MNLQEFQNSLTSTSMRDEVVIELPDVNELLEYISCNLTPASGNHTLPIKAVTFDGARLVIETEVP